MYLIANATSSFIEIADLGVSLQPKQAIDLHAVGLKGRAEKSPSLQKAKKNGWIKVLKQDKPKQGETRVVEKTTERIIDKRDSFNKEDMLNGIRGIIKEEIQNVQQNQPQQQLQEELMVMLSKLVAGSGVGVSNSGTGQQVDSYEDDNIDQSKLVEIHTKVAERAMKDVESSISYTEENIKDDSMVDNISELEDLL